MNKVIKMKFERCLKLINKMNRLPDRVETFESKEKYGRIYVTQHVWIRPYSNLPKCCLCSLQQGIFYKEGVMRRSAFGGTTTEEYSCCIDCLMDLLYTSNGILASALTRNEELIEVFTQK